MRCCGYKRECQDQRKILQLLNAGIAQKRFLAWVRALWVPCSTRSYSQATCRYNSSIVLFEELQFHTYSITHSLFDPLPRPVTAGHTRAIALVRLHFPTHYGLIQKDLFNPSIS